MSPPHERGDPRIPSKEPTLTDSEVVRRIRQGETALFEIVMRRYNQRLFRVARAIVKDDDEAEDVMQQAYVNAYRHLDQFAGRARFGTWLTKIAVHEALARIRRKRRQREVNTMPEEEASIPERFVATALDPEQQALTSELRAHLESAFDDIPEIYRSVFILRVVEGLDTAETAECLGINGDAVKTRLRRARALLRTEMLGRAGLDSADVFRFHLSRCDRVVASVSTRLHLPAPLKPQCDCPGEFCRSFG